MLFWTCHHPTRMQKQHLPTGFVSISSAFRNDALPLESLALLPGGEGSQGFLKQIAEQPLKGPGIGLFLSDPFLNIKQVSNQLKKLNISWLANLPSIAQHDEEFRGELADVNISVARELEVLNEFRQQGFHTLAAISSVDQASSIADYPSDAILVLQTTTDLQISFPSLPQRLKKAKEIAALDTIANYDILPIVMEPDLTLIDHPAMLRPVWFNDRFG